MCETIINEFPKFKKLDLNASFNTQQYLSNEIESYLKDEDEEDDCV